MHALISGCIRPSDDRHMRDEGIHLSNLRWDLIAYRREYGDYPDSLESAELARYTEGQSAFDVWGNKVSYTNTANGFEIRSAGPDGTFETDDDMALDHTEK